MRPFENDNKNPSLSFFHTQSLSPSPFLSDEFQASGSFSVFETENLKTSVLTIVALQHNTKPDSDPNSVPGD